MKLLNSLKIKNLTTSELETLLLALKDKEKEVMCLIDQKKRSVKDDLTSISPFDFETHSKVYSIMKAYFKDLELFLRSANLISYLHYLNSTKEVEGFWSQFEKQTNKKKYLIDNTDVFITQDMVYWWYNHFNPEKNTTDNIEALLDKYSYYPDLLFNRLYKKYIDPEWDEYTTLWFSEKDLSLAKKKQHTEIDLDKLSHSTNKRGYKVTELKVFLRELGLAVSGKKSILVGRLLDYYK